MPVTQGTSGTQASTVSLDRLFDAKLSIPKVREGVVSRADVIERARNSGCRFVGITAPAGYGKTTLLGEWGEREERPVAFVSFDRFDDDPGRLVALLAAALTQVAPDASDLAVDVSGPASGVLGRAAPLLASVLRTTPAPFVLMLDDLHELTLPECDDVLGLVMSGVPRHSQVVISSRTQPAHIPRLRASGDALELIASDLALGAAGAEQLFASHGLNLTPDQASLLAQKTEGWPVGLFLAALAAKEEGDDAISITGEDRYVADYLYHEAQAQLSDDVQEFLRRTSILEEMSAPLCDTILERSDSSQVLGFLEGSQLFLVSLDRRREWFRYHDLFREFLQSRLRTVEPDLVPELHLRAADWYEKHGAAEKAVEHLLETSESERCAQLLSEVVLVAYQEGRVSTLTRWFSRLGEPAIVKYPPLAVLAGDIAVLTGQTSEAERWLSIVDGLSFDGLPRDGTASFESSRAVLRGMMCLHGPEAMLADAAKILEEEPSWSPWRPGGLHLSAEAHLLLDEIDRARELFEATSVLAVEVASTDNLLSAEAHLAVLAMESGRWDVAATHAARSMSVIDEYRMSDYAPSTLGFASSARVALNAGDMEKANTLLARGMRARQFSTAAYPTLAIRSRLQLAKAWLALSDVSFAHHLIREIKDILYRRPRVGALVEDVDSFAQDVASNKIRMPGRAPLTPAELRLLPYLQTHLTFPEIAERLFVSRNTVRSQVAAVYRKLGVSSRGEAVERATEIGLLGA